MFSQFFIVFSFVNCLLPLLFLVFFWSLSILSWFTRTLYRCSVCKPVLYLLYFSCWFSVCLLIHRCLQVLCNQMYQPFISDFFHYFFIQNIFLYYPCHFIIFLVKFFTVIDFIRKEVCCLWTGRTLLPMRATVGCVSLLLCTEGTSEAICYVLTWVLNMGVPV